MKFAAYFLLGAAIAGLIFALVFLLEIGGQRAPDASETRSPPAEMLPAADGGLAREELLTQMNAEREKLRREADAMAAQAATKATREKEQRLAELNRRLAAEAQAREAAEIAAADLSRQLAALEKRTQELNKQREDIAERANVMESSRRTEDAEVQKLLANLRASAERANKLDRERARLLKAQRRLDAEREAALARQAAMEQEIVESGGEITLTEERRVWSPNYRPMR